VRAAGPIASELERIDAALAEDAASRDVTTSALVPADATGAAEIRVKGEGGVVAGLGVAAAVFARLDASCAFVALAEDGDRVAAGTTVARVEGRLRVLLEGERTAVNFLQRMGGIATLTARFAEAVAGTGVAILATRKTAPGLRPFDLAAVRAGGGGVHRGSLAERVLVKENHLRAARAAGTAATMREAVALVVGAARGAAVGIEAADLDELRGALVPGVDVVLLDNFTPEACVQAAAIRRAAFPAGDGPLLEASGGVTLANVRAYAATGVERISVGALTHSAPALDVSMTVTR
jgi:nicotinate-nucleotide pyrophosphorylase (carboxylating)